MLKYAILLVPFLSSCTALELIERVERFDADFERLDGRAATPMAALPASGTARYFGVAGITISPGTAGESVLLGDANITANFGTNAVTGRLSDFGRYDGGISTTSFSGVLTLQDGVIVTGDEAHVAGDVVGSLRGGGDTIEVDGAFEGVFGGNPIEGIVATTGAGRDVLTFNGAQVNAEVAFYGTPVN